MRDLVGGIVMNHIYTQEIDYDKFSFHESTIMAFQVIHNNCYIILGDIVINEISVKVKIEIDEVSKIFVDSKKSSKKSLTMFSEDGEILSLKISSSMLDILIEWNDFSEKIYTTRHYRIDGKKTRLIVID